MISVYKIQDNETGLYSTGGTYPSWTKKGKTWSTLGHLKSSVTQYLKGNYWEKKKRVIPDSWMVVELSESGLKITPLKELYEENKSK